jgi:Oxidoreductase family, C-terminal alpha/beta domain
VLRLLDSESYRKIEDAPHPEMRVIRPGFTGVRDAAIFIGTEGWVALGYDNVFTNPASLMESVIGPNEIRLPDSALPEIPAGMPKSHQQVATAAHHQNWIQAIRGGKPPVGDIESAVRSDMVCQLSELCVRTGQSLKWDPARETIKGNQAARKMMSRPMRGPWQLA